jgi:NADH:ubiquinone oxidoreductase subunit H
VLAALAVAAVVLLMVADVAMAVVDGNRLHCDSKAVEKFADAIKLFTKEQTKPKIINKIPFILAPALALALTLLL